MTLTYSHALRPESSVTPVDANIKTSAVSMALTNHEVPFDVDIGADVCQNVMCSDPDDEASSHGASNGECPCAFCANNKCAAH